MNSSAFSCAGRGNENSITLISVSEQHFIEWGGDWFVLWFSKIWTLRDIFMASLDKKLSLLQALLYVATSK